MSDVLSREAIVLGGQATDRDAAITEAGRLLVASGAVDEAYVDAMHERETSVSTFMGNGLAIPHGTNEAKALIRHTAISFVRYDEPIDWKGSPARYVVGIAGAGDDHLTSAPETWLTRLAASGRPAGRGQTAVTATGTPLSAALPDTSSSSGSVRSLTDTPGTSRLRDIRTPSPACP